MANSIQNLWRYTYKSAQKKKTYKKKNVDSRAIERPENRSRSIVVQVLLTKYYCALVLNVFIWNTGYIPRPRSHVSNSKTVYVRPRTVGWSLFLVILNFNLAKIVFDGVGDKYSDFFYPYTPLYKKRDSPFNLYW